MAALKQLPLMRDKLKEIVRLSNELVQLDNEFGDTRPLHFMRNLVWGAERLAEIMAEFNPHPERDQLHAMILDYKNLLSVIRGYADLLTREPEVTASPPQLERVNQILVLIDVIIDWWMMVQGEWTEARRQSGEIRDD